MGPSGANPRVSVIIPSYNTAALIAACLDSVFSQTFRDYEVIVVNDGSPDTPHLEDAVRPYADKIIYIRQENKRVGGARNTAIRQARGEFLAFLDSDDSWLPGHLASQMNMFEQDSTLDLVYADALQIGEAGRGKSFMEKCPSGGPATFEALVLERCQVPISTVVARTNAIVKAGMFDESLPRCEDYDMWLRAAFHGAKIAYGRTPQAQLNLGRPGSLGQFRAKLSEAYWKILEKTAATLPLNDAQRKLVQDRAAEAKANYLVQEARHQLRERHPEKARELFEQANSHLHLSKLSVAIGGLRLAPHTTSRLIAVWDRLVNALTV